MSALNRRVRWCDQADHRDIDIGLDIEPEKGAADSGELETGLPNLFVAVAEPAAERKSSVALLIDEIQYFNQKELGALIMGMHRLQQRQTGSWSVRYRSSVADRPGSSHVYTATDW